MAREEKRWCYFDGANGWRRPTLRRIPLILVILCTLLAGSLAAAGEHGECLCVSRRARARATVQMSFTYLRIYAPRRTRARAPFDNLLRIAEDSFRSGRGKRERGDANGGCARGRKRNDGDGTSETELSCSTSKTSFSPFFSLTTI